MSKKNKIIKTIYFWLNIPYLIIAIIIGILALSIPKQSEDKIVPPKNKTKTETETVTKTETETEKKISNTIPDKVESFPNEEETNNLDEKPNKKKHDIPKVTKSTDSVYYQYKPVTPEEKENLEKRIR